MRKRITGAIFLLLSLSVVERVHGRHGGHAQRNARLGLQIKPAAADEDRDKLLAVGKKIFVERCAKCHDAGGDKPLKTGLPLSKRELSYEEIARAVAGRLKEAPDEEKRAVALYVSSFMHRK